MKGEDTVTRRIGTFVMLCAAVIAGAQLPQLQQVLQILPVFAAQPAFGQYPPAQPNVAAQPNVVWQQTEVPQVVVRQQAELPKCAVDFVSFEDPANPARKIRVITVVDTEAKKIAVYHEELANGKVWLMSVRDIKPDLLIDQFNAVPPFPSEVGREIRRLKNK
jgi:hypothetical protein